MQKDKKALFSCFQMPDHFDHSVVLNQLRYSGMLETVRIRRAGFPVRRTFQDFCTRCVPFPVHMCICLQNISYSVFYQLILAQIQVLCVGLFQVLQVPPPTSQTHSSVLAMLNYLCVWMGMFLLPCDKLLSHPRYSLTLHLVFPAQTTGLHQPWSGESTCVINTILIKFLFICMVI